MSPESSNDLPRCHVQEQGGVVIFSLTGSRHLMDTGSVIQDTMVCLILFFVSYLAV